MTNSDAPNPTDCLSNLPICKASCCRYLSFDMNYITEELADYYIKHGCKLIRIGRMHTKIVVPMLCPQLDTNTNLCKLHDTDAKPKSCMKLNEETMKAGRYYCTEGCIYGN